MSRAAVAAFAAAWTAAAGIAGCGGGAPNVDAPSGTPVVQDGVTYTVQTSRELNPFEAGDRQLLAGLSRRKLTELSHDALVGVFLQASNDGTRPRRAIAAPELVSAEGQVYRPLRLPRVDPFAYRGGRLPSHGQLPAPDSQAAQGPDDGAVLVYRVPNGTFVTNRPFILRLGHGAAAASVQLDL